MFECKSLHWVQVIFQGKCMIARLPSGGDVEHVGVQIAPAFLAIPIKQVEGRIGDYVLFAICSYILNLLFLFSSLAVFLWGQCDMLNLFLMLRCPIQKYFSLQWWHGRPLQPMSGCMIELWACLQSGLSPLPTLLWKVFRRKDNKCMNFCGSVFSCELCGWNVQLERVSWWLCIFWGC